MATETDLSTPVEHREMTSEEYHANITHDSNSSLSLFNESPATYNAIRVAKTMKAPATTRSQRFGHLLHTAILEPEKIDKLRLMMTKDEYEQVRWSAANVWKNPRAVENLKRCSAFEHTLFWTTKYGHNLKVRFDGVQEIESCFLDIKSHKWRNESDFWRSVKEYGYHRQAAIYSAGFKAAYGTKPTVKYILVPNFAPYEDVLVRTMPEAAIDLGREENKHILAKLKICRETNVWHTSGYDKEWPIEIPTYFYPAGAY